MPETTNANPFLVGHNESSAVATNSSQPMNRSKAIQQSTSLSEDVRLAMLNWSSTIKSGNCTTSVREISSTLLSIMPEMHAGEHLSSAVKISQPINRDTSFQMMKLAIYLLSNNLLTLSPSVEDKITQFLHLEENFPILGYLLSIDSPTAEALAEALFRSAIEAENIKIVNALINSGFSSDRQVIKHGCWQYTPLQYATLQGNVKLARILIEAGTDVNATAEGEDDANALHLASRNGNSELVKMILAAGAEVNELQRDGESALHLAVQYSKDIGSIQLLLAAGADINSLDDKGRTALHLASQYSRDIGSIQLLLAAGADINSLDDKGRPALHLASQYSRDIGSIQLLLAAGADIDGLDDEGRTALHGAVERSEIDLVEVLLRAGADVNSMDGEGRTALRDAVKGNEIDIVKVLLRAGADVNSMDDKGRTALHDAVKGNEIDIVKVLLRAGADSNVGFVLHETTLEGAVRGEYKDVVRVLLDAGARSFGSALCFAAMNCDVEMAQMLLRAGAEVDCLGHYGETALTWAALGGNVNLLRILLKAGADVDGCALVNGACATTTPLQAASSCATIDSARCC